MKNIDGAGIIVPLLTPLEQDESVNFAQLGALAEHVVTGGVDAVLAMGSTGEFARFSPETRGAIVAEIVHSVGGRVPVYAGVGDTGLKNVLRNMAIAEKAGADALAVTLPYYYPISGDAEALAFYKPVVRAANLPVMLYNIPSTCGASLSLDTVERLFDQPAVIGIKDSEGDLPRLLEEIRRFKNRSKRFAVTVGAEELSYAGMKAGADGIVPSMANPFPRLFAALYAAARAEDDEALRKYCGIVDDFNRINAHCDSWMAPNAWRKRALSHMGICNDRCTMPCLPLDEKTDRLVLAAIDRYSTI